MKCTKKMMASVLAICVFVLQLQPAFAVNSGVTVAKNDREVLDKMGITTFATITSEHAVVIDNEEKTEYQVAIGSITNEITVLENSDEKQSIQVVQGDICNRLDIYTNGDIVLDGNLVEVTREEVVEPTSDDIVTYAGATIYWKDTPDYGKASDYSNFLKNENVKDIALKQKVSKIAVSALMSILGKAMSGGIVARLTKTAANKIYSYFIKQDPYSEQLSCKSKVYTHKSYVSGYIPERCTFIYKYKSTFYSEKNYGGSYIDADLYKHNMQG